jgi:AP-3 complex subunit mu
MEKHWKSVIHRSICDYFFEAQGKCSKPEDIPTVIAAPHHKLVVVYRNKLYFIAVVINEVSPLFVVEILHRAVDIFEDYFGECNETVLKENFVVVYEVNATFYFYIQTFYFN